MSEAAVIPAVTEISATPPDPVFKEIFSTPENTPVEQAKPEPKAKAKTEPKAEDKPEGKRWDKIEPLKKPEAKEEEALTDDTQSTDDDADKSGQTRWKELKSVEKAVKNAKSVDDLLKIPGVSDAIKEAIEALKSPKAAELPEGIKQEFESLRQMYAEESLDNDPNFQREVLQPINRSWKNLGDVAKEAGLDETKAQALVNAVRNTSEVSRSRAIRRIIATGVQEDAEGESSPLSDDDISTLATLAISTANNLHNSHWPKEAQARHEAQQIALARREKSSHDTAVQKQEREQQYDTEAKRIGSILKERIPLVFEEHPEAMEVINTARPSQDIADQVYDAQAGHIVTYMGKTINSLMEKLAKAESLNKAREAAKPRSGDGRLQAPKREDAMPSFNEVFGMK